MDIQGAWTLHGHTDIHSCFFSEWVIRHGYCMDTSTRVTYFKHPFRTFTMQIASDLYNGSEIRALFAEQQFSILYPSVL